jgi:hypothetical protein
MENNKATKEKFLDLLMYKYYTHGNIVTEEQDQQVRTNFRLQMNWTRHRGDLPKRVKDML